MARSARVLLVSHDAGGTIPPMLALAEALVTDGHNVVWIGQPSIEARAAAAGCEFSAFPGVPSYAAGTTIEDQLAVSLPLIAGHEAGEHVLAIARGGCDLAIVDANLAGCAAALETLDAPTAVLLHSMYATFTDVWFADYWPLLEPVVNTTRQHFGRDMAASWSDLFSGHDRVMSIVPPSFDAPSACSPPAALRHYGFLVPSRSYGGAVLERARGDDPLVVVALSTTYQHQDSLLQAILTGLASLPVKVVASTAGQVDRSTLDCPANAVVHDYLDHRRVLDDCAVMVTHAGLGSLAAALHRGVPAVCTPIGRDQELNAARVGAIGAGIDLGRDPAAAAIGSAVTAVLTNDGFADAAGRVGTESRRLGGATAAVDDVVSLIG